MSSSGARSRPLPPCAPLSTAPAIPLCLEYPPEDLYIGVAWHGRLLIEQYCESRWCFHLFRWTGAVTFAHGDGSMTLPVRPGYTDIFPARTPLTHYFGQNPATHLFALFALPPPPPGARLVYLPAVQDLGDDFGGYCELAERAIAAFPTHPRRACATLWDILWRLAERAPVSAISEAPLHPAVVRVTEMIELRLGEPLRVADLAHAVDLSHNHLTRLFREATGQSVISYIRERRVARARQLLQQTTVPIKAIAMQVGLPDLHQFNKTLRLETGLSPRNLRRKPEGRDENVT